MALQPVKGGMWFPERLRTDGGNPILNLTLDAAGESAGFIVQAPAPGNIKGVGYSLMSVSVTAGPLNFPFRLEGVGSGGLPSGSLLATGSEGVDSIANSDGVTTRVRLLNSVVAVTQSQDIAFTLNAPASGTYAVQLATLGGDFIGMKPYAHANGAKVARVPVFSFLYDDDIWRTPVGCLPLLTIGLLDYTSESDPDEAGNYYEFSFRCAIDAVYMFIDPDADTTVDILVVDDSGTVRCNMSVVCNVHATLGDGTVEIQLVPVGGQDLIFDAGEGFYVMARASGVGFEFWYLTVADAAHMAMLDGGQLIHAAHRVDAGSFVPELTRRYIQSVRISALEDGAGGGGGGDPYPVDVATGSRFNRGFN